MLVSTGKDELVYKTGYDLSDAEIKDRYSRLGGLIDLPPHFYHHVATLLAEISPAGGRVLDVGCGNGHLLDHLAGLRSDLELRGFDVAWGSARTSRGRGRGRWQVVQASGLHLPFADRSFDVVSMVEVLEHVKEPLTALHEATRLLRRGGRVLITVPNLSAWDPFWRWAERSGLEPAQMIFLPSEHPLRTAQPIDTAYTYAELRALVAQAGLQVEAQHGRGFFPYLISTAQLLTGSASSAAAAAINQADARDAAEPTLIKMHTRLDELLSRVLPAQLGYRLSLECRPLPVG